MWLAYPLRGAMPVMCLAQVVSIVPNDTQYQSDHRSSPFLISQLNIVEGLTCQRWAPPEAQTFFGNREF